MMIGGAKGAVDHLDPIFAALAPGLGDIPRTPDRATTAMPAPSAATVSSGPSGAGHLVSRVHNGIRYWIDGSLRRRLRHLAQQELQGPARGRALHAERWVTSPRSGGAAASSHPGCWISAPPRWRRIRSWRTLSGFIQTSREEAEMDGGGSDRGSGSGGRDHGGAAPPVPPAARAQASAGKRFYRPCALRASAVASRGRDRWIPHRSRRTARRGAPPRSKPLSNTCATTVRSGCSKHARVVLVSAAAPGQASSDPSAPW